MEGLVEPPRGLRLVIAYDGTRFHGFQKQTATRTVQGVLTDAIRALDPEATEPRGASRTDAGVHARGQVVGFDAVRELPPKGWRLLLNKQLPDDLSVRSVEPCEAGYNPRFDSLGKEYRYFVYAGESRDPLREPQAFHVGPAFALPGATGERIERWLDLDKMREAASYLLGRHDFQAFRAADDTRENTVRELRALDVKVHPDEPDSLAFIVVGDAFMKNMVRILVGTLLDVGRGKRAPESVRGLLGAAGSRAHAGQTMPAHGLRLERVHLGRIALTAMGMKRDPG